MSEKNMVILDGNEAAASVAYRLTEVVAIYPSPLVADGRVGRSVALGGKEKHWAHCHRGRASERRRSVGACTARCRRSIEPTFTASQGLLLMIPKHVQNRRRADPATMHVTARTLATHALSIFGDHSDVMACRRRVGDAGLQFRPGSCRHGAGSADCHAGIAHSFMHSLTASALRMK